MEKIKTTKSIRCSINFLVSHFFLWHSYGSQPSGDLHFFEKTPKKKKLVTESPPYPSLLPTFPLTLKNKSWSAANMSKPSDSQSYYTFIFQI